MAAAISRKSSPWKALTSSGSRRSLSVVKPARSANRTVTSRRSASGSGPPASSAFADGRDAWGSRGTGPPRSPGSAGPPSGAGARRPPQRGQKANSLERGAPLDGHVEGSRLPHFGQKAKSGGDSKPQSPQRIATGYPQGRRAVAGSRDGVLDLETPFRPP